MRHDVDCLLGAGAGRPAATPDDAFVAGGAHLGDAAAALGAALVHKVAAPDAAAAFTVPLIVSAPCAPTATLSPLQVTVLAPLSYVHAGLQLA